MVSGTYLLPICALFILVFAGGVVQEKITLLVSTIQRMVVDSHLLFFAKVDSQGSAGKVMNGIFQYHVHQLIARFSVLFHKPSSKKEISNCTYFELFTRQEEKEAMEIIKKWFNEKIVRITEKCSSLLSSLTSAIQVAQLQQSTYALCNKFSLPDLYLSDTLKMFPSLVSNGPFSTPVQNCWHESCIELLHGKNSSQSMQYSSKEDSEKAPLLTSPLWSIVFRVSFLHQVERLLQESCDAILVSVKEQVISSLQSFGIQVFDKGYETKFDPLFRGNVNVASSATFFLAEKVRLIFDRSLAKLIDDVISPVQHSDQSQEIGASSCALSGMALMNVLKSNCSKLIGQLISFFRKLSEQLRVILQSSRSLSCEKSELFKLLDSPLTGVSSKLRGKMRDLLHSFHSNNPLDGKSERSVQQSKAALASVLFIGRVAWLLKCRCDSIKHAFRTNKAKPATNSNYGGDAHRRLVSVTEEQFRSAFEIADTDGDGVVDQSEVVEVRDFPCFL